LNFPEPVISVAIEPKTKSDQEKMGMALGKLMQEDPTFKVHTDKETNQTIISGMGSSTSRSSSTGWSASSTSTTSASPRSPTAKRSRRKPRAGPLRARPAATAVRRLPHPHPTREDGKGSFSRERHQGRDPEGIHRRSSRG
jgi:hypothetical protein